ncbi:hypothetical protein XENOCAPTIV_029185, partial [Xenoophorus captivus]
YDQKRDSSQCYLSDYEVNASRENEEMSSYYLQTLESSKTSGLSSSSYELSQYMNESDLSDRDMPPVFTSNGDGSWKPDVPTLIDFDEHPAVETPPSKGDDLLTGDPSSFRESPEKALQNYTQLLLAGRKKVQSFSYNLYSDVWI